MPALISLSIALAGGCRHSEAESAPPAAKAASAADVAPVAVKLVTSRELKVPRTLTLSGTLIGCEEARSRRAPPARSWRPTSSAARW